MRLLRAEARRTAMRAPPSSPRDQRAPERRSRSRQCASSTFALGHSSPKFRKRFETPDDETGCSRVMRAAKGEFARRSTFQSKMASRLSLRSSMTRKEVPAVLGMCSITSWARRCPRLFARSGAGRSAIGKTGRRTTAHVARTNSRRCESDPGATSSNGARWGYRSQVASTALRPQPRATAGIPNCW